MISSPFPVLVVVTGGVVTADGTTLAANAPITLCHDVELATDDSDPAAVLVAASRAGRRDRRTRRLTDE